MSGNNKKGNTVHQGENQRAELFGVFSVRDILSICQVNRKTAQRWKAGTHRIPYASRELLRFALEGTIPPNAAGAWPAWRFGHDGLLYAPDLTRGFTPEDLRQLHWLQQGARFMAAQHRAALRSQRDGIVADELLQLRKTADDVSREQ